MAYVYVMWLLSGCYKQRVDEPVAKATEAAWNDPTSMRDTTVRVRFRSRVAQDVRVCVVEKPSGRTLGEGLMLPAGGEVHLELDEPCNEGQLVCYGAWTFDSAHFYRIAGLGKSCTEPRCKDCCVRCGGVGDFHITSNDITEIGWYVVDE